MEVSKILTSLNWVDWGIIILLLFTVSAGLNRGFLLGTLDLLSLVVGIGAAVVGYRLVADFIVRIIEVPRALAIMVAFILLFLLAQMIYSAIANLIFRPLRIFLGPGRFIDSVLGILPGAISGLVFSTILLLPFATVAVTPQISASIERSVIGSRLVGTAVNLIPAIDSLIGQDLDEALSFLTPPQTDEGWDLEFGDLGQLTPDPAAEQRMLE